MRKWLFGMGFILAQAAFAEDIPSYGSNPQVVSHMETLAADEGMDLRYLESLLLALHRDDSVLKKISTPAEKRLAWSEYQKIFLDAARINNGVKFYDDNLKWFTKAYQQFGVDPFIIAAIIGVETRYGKVTGNTPALASLATLCFDYPPRAPFFCSEFDHLLELSKRENWNPLQIQGSYAGALGMAQFMPSSYLNDAIDFDGDGHVNLWASPADAIGSVANYLKNRGWQKDGKLVFPLAQPLENPDFGQTHEPKLPTAAVLADKSLENDQNLINWLGETPPQYLGSLVLQGQEKKLYYLTANNFFVITRYNTSPLYAMAVVRLASLIKDNVKDSENRQ